MSEDDPAVTEAKVNLAPAERIQQERAEKKEAGEGGVESVGGGREADMGNRGGGEAAEGAGGGRDREVDAGKGEAGGRETGRTAVRSDIAWVGEGGRAEAGGAGSVAS